MLLLPREFARSTMMELAVGCFSAMPISACATAELGFHSRSCLLSCRRKFDSWASTVQALVGKLPHCLPKGNKVGMKAGYEACGESI